MGRRKERKEAAVLSKEDGSERYREEREGIKKT